MERVQVDPADAHLKFAFRNLKFAILLCAMLSALGLVGALLLALSVSAQ